MYSEKVMDHFQNPRNVGEIENASGVGTVGNAKCGDIMRIFLETEQGGHLRLLSPGDKPEVEFTLDDGDKVVAVYEYCNLHGLWKAGC